MLKPPDIKQLTSAFSPLVFSIDEDEKLTKNPDIQNYLNFYKINFSQSIPGVRHGLGTFNSSGHTVFAHYWLPEIPRGTIFILHGYFDHVGLFNHLIRFSLQNEFAVVAYDLPGMGLSSGERASIDSFDEYYETLESCIVSFKNIMPKPWFGVGQSAGCIALMQHVLTDGLEPFKRVALLGPLVSSCGWKRDKWLYSISRFFIRSLPRVFMENSHDQDFLAFIKKSDPLQPRRLPIKWVGAMKEWIAKFPTFKASEVPVLIIQGDHDTTVDWQYNLQELKQKFPNATVKMVPQGRHHLVSESAPYRAQVFAAIKAFLDEK